MQMDVKDKHRTETGERYSFLENEVNVFDELLTHTKGLLAATPRMSLEDMETYIEGLCQASLDCMYEYNNDEDASTAITNRLRGLLHEYMTLTKDLLSKETGLDCRLADDLMCYRDHVASRLECINQKQLKREETRRLVDDIMSESPSMLAGQYLFNK